MKASDKLQQEHETIHFMLSVLKKLREQIEKGEEVDFGYLGEILEFFKIYVDKSHHKKEEGALFPKLPGTRMSEEGVLVRGLVQDHALLHNLVKEMNESFGGLKNGDYQDRDKFLGVSKRYITMLTEHALKEDKLLNPLIDKYLSSSEQESLEQQFTSIENREIGSSKIKDFQKLIQAAS